MSKLDPKLHGNQNSSITKEHIRDNLDGLTIEEVIFIDPFFHSFNSVYTPTQSSQLQ